MRGIDLLAMLEQRFGLRIEQRVAHAHRAEQHLRANGRQQLLRARVARRHLGGFALHGVDALRERVAGVEPQSQRHAETNRQGGSDRQALDLGALHYRNSMSSSRSRSPDSKNAGGPEALASGPPAT